MQEMGAGWDGARPVGSAHGGYGTGWVMPMVKFTGVWLSPFKLNNCLPKRQQKEEHWTWESQADGPTIPDQPQGLWQVMSPLCHLSRPHCPPL